MSDDRITETTTQPHTTTIIERRGGGGGLLIGLAILIAVIVGAVFLFNQSENDSLKTKAVTEAASDVGAAAEKVGESAEKAIDKIGE